MARSQNGYSANDINLTSVRTIPGTARSIRLRKGAAGDLLLWVLGRFDALVEDIDAGQLDDWGYAERPIRGGTELSNHASGTAADANAVRHPLGTDPAATFSKTQISTIRAIVARTEGCVRWGGDYVGRKDPMHFEIITPEPRCAAVLDKLTTTTPRPTPNVPKGLIDMREILCKAIKTGGRTEFTLGGTEQAAVTIYPGSQPVYLDGILWWGEGHVPGDNRTGGLGYNPIPEGGNALKLTGYRTFRCPAALLGELLFSSNSDFRIVVKG